MNEIFFGYLTPSSYLEERMASCVRLFQKVYAPLSHWMIGEEKELMDHALRSSYRFLLIQNHTSKVYLGDLQKGLRYLRDQHISVRFGDVNTYLVDLNHIRNHNPVNVMEYLRGLDGIPVLSEGILATKDVSKPIFEAASGLVRGDNLLPNQECIYTIDELLSGMENVGAFNEVKLNRQTRSPVCGRYKNVIVQSSIFDILELIASGSIDSSSRLTMLYRSSLHKERVEKFISSWGGYSPHGISMISDLLTRPISFRIDPDEISVASYDALMDRFGGKRSFMELWQVFRSYGRYVVFTNKVGGDLNALRGNDIVLLGDTCISYEYNLRYDEDMINHQYTQLRSMMLKGDVMLSGYTPSGLRISA